MKRIRYGILILGFMLLNDRCTCSKDIAKLISDFKVIFTIVNKIFMNLK